MPQLNEYSIEELKDLRSDLIHCFGLQVQHRYKGVSSTELWMVRVNEAIADRELSDSQLPFRTPKQIEQDEETNNVTFI